MMHRSLVVVIDDNPGDVALIQEAFVEAQFTADILAAASGDKGLELLDRLAAEGRLPDLLLLDLNLPRMNGLEVLAAIRSRNVFADMPVVILSTSNRNRDREAAQRLGAAGYLVKPPVFTEFLEQVNTLAPYLNAR